MTKKPTIASVPAATAEDILDLFRRVGALLDGHFRLTSGLHSPGYLQCALVLQHPREAEACGTGIADRVRGLAPTAVLSPALGGIVIGHEVARALGVRAIFAERQDGTLTLRRGFTIGSGERVLVIEDVVTTAGSTRETIDLARAAGATVVRAVEDSPFGTRGFIVADPEGLYWSVGTLLPRLVRDRNGAWRQPSEGSAQTQRE